MRKAKQLILLLCIAVLACTVAACGGKKATTVSLSASELSLQAGSTAALTASVSDGSAATWSSSDTSVAYYRDGMVHGISAGTAVLTASVGSASASCTVTVTPKPAETPDSVVVTISATSLELMPNQTATLTSSIRINGSASGNTVAWTSSDPCVTLTPDGNTVTVHAVSNGTAKVKATYGDKSAACTVTVAETHTVTGSVAIASKMSLNGVGVDAAAVTLTSGTVSRTADVAADGTYRVQIPQGTYTVTASHPNYGSVSTTVDVSDDASVPAMTFAHYNFGNTLNTNAVWAYDEATQTLNVERTRNGNSNISYHFLNGSASTHYAVTAKVSSYAYKWSKFGFVYHGGDTAVEAAQYTIMFSPSQNEVNFYQGQTEIRPTVTRYNGAVGLTNSRTSLPADILVAPEHTPTAYDPLKPNDKEFPLLDNKDITISLVRESEKLYVFVNETLYLRVDLPDEIKDRPGLIGFRNQDMYQVHVSNIAYDMGETVSTAALAVDIAKTVTNGTITDSGNLKLGEEITLTVTPNAGKEVTGVTLDGAPIQMTGDTQASVTVRFTAEKTAYTVVATIGDQIVRRTVQGTVSAGSLNTFDLSQTTVAVGNLPPITVDANGSFTADLTVGTYTVVYRHPHYADVTVENVTISEGAGTQTLSAATFTHYKLNTEMAGEALIPDYGTEDNTYMFTVNSDQKSCIPFSFSDPTATEYVVSVTLNGSKVPDTTKFGLVVGWDGVEKNAQQAFRLVVSRSQNEMHLMKGYTDVFDAYEVFNGASKTSGKRFNLPSGVIATTSGTTIKELTLTAVRANEVVYVFVNNTLYVKLTLEDLKNKAGLVGLTSQGVLSATFSNFTYAAGAQAVADALAVTVNTTATEDGTITVSESPVLGQQVTVTVTPNAGKEVTSVTLDGQPMTIAGNTAESVTGMFVPAKTTYQVAATFTDYVPRRDVSGSVAIHSDLNKYDLSQTTITVGNLPIITGVVAEDGTFTATVPTGTYDITYRHPAYGDVVVSNVAIAEGDNAQALAGVTFTHYRMDTDNYAVDNINKNTVTYEYGTAANTYVTHNSDTSKDPVTFMPFGFAKATDYVISATLNASNMPQYSKIGIIIGWQTVDNITTAYRIAVDPSQNQVNFYAGGGEQSPVYEVFNGASIFSGNTKRVNLPAGILVWNSSAKTMQEVSLTVVRLGKDVHVFVNGTQYLTAHIDALDGKDCYVGLSTQGVHEAEFSKVTYSTDVSAFTGTTAKYTAVSDENATVSVEGTAADGSIAAGGGNLIRVTATPGDGKIVTGIEVTIGNGLTCGNGFATGAGWLIPVTMSCEYTVKAVTVDAAASDLIAYTGTIALDEYYQYDATNNPGMWPDDGYTANVAGRDNLTVLAGGRFKYDLVHGFGAIDAKEIIAEFTGSSGTYSATLGTPVYDADGGVYKYPYTVYLPAGEYTYKVRDIDYLSYYLNYNKANSYTLTMINRLQPMTGTVTVSDTNGVTVTLGEYDYTYLQSKGSYEQGTTNSDLLCANGTAYTVDTAREEGAVWRTYGTSNFYTDVSEPVFMASWETVAGDTKPWIRFRFRKQDGGNDQGLWAGMNDSKVFYDGYPKVLTMQTAADAVNFNSTGTDLWQIIRKNDQLYIYINGEQVAHYTFIVYSKDMYMPFMMYDLTCKNLKFTFNTAIIDGVMNPAQR